MEIEIPAAAKTVTPAIDRVCVATLRSLLPRICDDIELVIEDVHGTDRPGVRADRDLYRLHAGNGDALLHKLKRSRVVEGESLLDLEPKIKLRESKPELIGGTIRNVPGTGCIELWVRPPAPDERD